MKLHVKVLIVGGGVVGASIAYHLQKGGWDNIVLIERDELTSGSTWHAAGLLPLFNMSYATSHIHDYSVKFYKNLEKELGTDIGFKVVGNLRMAQTQERLDEFMLYSSTADTVNIPYEWKSPKQIKEKWPLVYSEDLKGAIYHPTDGYINPADLTQAIAKSARTSGVKIERKTQADSFFWDGKAWHVKCSRMIEKGGNLIPSEDTITFVAEHVVTATGNHVQNTANLINTKIAAIPVEHQYIVTEEDPKLIEYRKNNDEHPVLRDADAKWYVREERGGWILGPYEKNAPARFKYKVPENFRADLFPLDLDRIEQEYLSFIKRIPSTENLGIKDDFNGPICYTPDGNPLLGPAFGLRNLWLAEGFSFGITAAGGAGYYLAQMMINGEAEIDMTSLDPKRYGSWITTEYTARKNEECYEHVYVLHHPDEERPACRPLRTFPCYERLKNYGAQFGQVNGWERPNYFAEKDFNDLNSRSFRRGKWWEYTQNEAKAIREKVGLIDISAFTKHLVKGPGAALFLDWFTCNNLPKINRISLTYSLTSTGTVRSEYTIVRKSQNEFYLISAGAHTDYDKDYLIKNAEDKEREFGYIEIQDVTSQFGAFAIAGPRSKEFLISMINDEEPSELFSNKNFPWLSSKNVELDMIPILAIRVAYTGELGWELHYPVELQNKLLDILLEAGKKFDLKLVGSRAQNWLRQEKSYRAFGNELGRDSGLVEAGLDKFVNSKKEFLGKSGLQNRSIKSKCVTLLIDGPKDCDPWGREAIYKEGKTVGRLTSGGYSVVFEKSIGMGYIKKELANLGEKLEVKILNQLWPATIVEDSPYDTDNLKLKNR
ncbi:MAG: FAD-dependent oxidoreductase [Paracoccaceae bacterium]